MLGFIGELAHHRANGRDILGRDHFIRRPSSHAGLQDQIVEIVGYTRDHPGNPSGNWQEILTGSWRIGAIGNRRERRPNADRKQGGKRLGNRPPTLGIDRPIDRRGNFPEVEPADVTIRIEIAQQGVGPHQARGIERKHAQRARKGRKFTAITRFAPHPATVCVPIIDTFTADHVIARKVGIASDPCIKEGLIEEHRRLHQDGDLCLRSGQRRDQRRFADLWIKGVVGANHIGNHRRGWGDILIGQAPPLRLPNRTDKGREFQAG